MIIECKCGATANYSSECQCPNDVIEETGFVQDEDGNWLCHECQGEE